MTRRRAHGGDEAMVVIKPDDVFVLCSVDALALALSVAALYGDPLRG